jgi:hypothetical protein
MARRAKTRQSRSYSRCHRPGMLHCRPKFKFQKGNFFSANHKCAINGFNVTESSVAFFCCRVKRGGQVSRGKLK